MDKAIICPTITAFDQHSYRDQMERLKPFAKRVHIDLMDGEFTPTKSPDLSTIWWLDEFEADVHLMYRRPMEYIDELIKLKPSLVVIHYEAEVDHAAFANKLHEHDIRAGLAILKDTSVQISSGTMADFEHVLVFSGNLGHQGGEADLNLLDKVGQIKELYKDKEISWDGGINDQNAKALVSGGIDVLNVGSFIQKSDNPAGAYSDLETILQQ